MDEFDRVSCMDIDFDCFINQRFGGLIHVSNFNIFEKPSILKVLDKTNIYPERLKLDVAYRPVGNGIVIPTDSMFAIYATDHDALTIFWEEYAKCKK